MFNLHIPYAGIYKLDVFYIESINIKISTCCVGIYTQVGNENCIVKLLDVHLIHYCYVHLWKRRQSNIISHGYRYMYVPAEELV